MYLSIIYIFHKKKIKIKQYVFTFKIDTIILLVHEYIDIISISIENNEKFCTYLINIVEI